MRTIPTTTTSPQVASAATTDAPSAQLASEVTAMMRKGHVPGLSLAIVNREGLRLAAGFGSANLQQRTPPTSTTEYLWFSMSKIVTATAAMRLADEGQLDLDAPVGEYVPYLRAPGATQPSTRHLLNHTAGLANPIPIRWAHAVTRHGRDAADLLRRQMSHRRAYRYPVGGSARYSNLGYLAAGEVISAAAGERFESYVGKHVLEPAGMHHTSYTYDDGRPRATGYARVPRVVTPALRAVLPAGVVGRRHGEFVSLNEFYVDGPAYGGLVGDVLDAAQFLRLHLNEGEVDGHRVLEPATCRTMQVLDQPGKTLKHGIGWFQRPTANADWVEHFGSGAGFWNVMRLYPARGIGVVVMSNSTTSYDFESLFALVADEYS
ncbi:MAG TPA: serine hydrolase domain-containing protein [Actinomycetes bacterium]|nr:serine hydrolase domain-containing protein [Actinomycetes bacterium]